MQNQKIKISDALLYTIYKNGGKMTNIELLNFIKKLNNYKMLKINKDGFSYSLTERGRDRLEKIELINKS